MKSTLGCACLKARGIQFLFSLPFNVANIFEEAQSSSRNKRYTSVADLHVLQLLIPGILSVNGRYGKVNILGHWNGLHPESQLDNCLSWLETRKGHSPPFWGIVP